MDLLPTDDQSELAAAVRALCEARFDVDSLRELEGSGFDAGRWGDLAGMGVFAATLEESAGGAGLGAAEAVLVFEELGRALVPGPVLWTQLAAGIVDGAAAGETVVGGLDLTGGAAGPHLVAHLDACDAVIGVAEDRVLRWDADAMRAVPLADSLDPLTPVHHVEELPPGDEIGGAEAAGRMVADATVLTAAFEVGLATAVTDMASTYALDREQFGKPIGAFQAVKHILADMVVRAEVARSAVYAAGATLDDPEAGDLDRIVHAAKICADLAADKNARACIQVHGGMGYTWEVPAHYFLKRAWVLEPLFGGIAEHADAVAASLVS
ncbi:MAG: acyl-CoA dehydrogenase family protein [Acidimicrobiia bacterium]|nr:acyl-CoA dehydrogenase family protein [Acidimicrobiia bacterium]